MSQSQEPSFQPVHHGSPALSYSAFKPTLLGGSCELLNKWRFSTENKARASFHPKCCLYNYSCYKPQPSCLVQVSMLQPYFNCIMSSNTVITAHCSDSSKSESPRAPGAPGAPSARPQRGAASVASFATFRGDAQCPCLDDKNRSAT